MPKPNTESAAYCSRGVERFLGAVKRAGNALPHPITLLAGAAVLVLLLSAIAGSFGISVLHPSTG